MIKTFFIAGAAIIAGSSAAALPLRQPVDPGFGVEPAPYLVRGDAYAIRSCGDAYGSKTDVCYNQKTTGQLFPFSRGIGISVSRNRVVRVNCDADFDRSDKTTRGQIATEYCPQAADGTLAPAPFLL